ncbi:MAG: AsmA family protein, partial [Rhizobiales bacterium]|nr:AsmA family protein [Hyphomicrobiales bacterium]
MNKAEDLVPIDDTDQFPTVMGPDETPSDAGIDAAKRVPQRPISQQPLAADDVLPASEIAVPNEALRYVNETAPPVSTQVIPTAPALTTPAQPSVPNLDEPQNVQMDAQWEIENAVGQRPLSAAQQPNLDNVAATIPVLPNDPPLNEGQVETPPVSNKLPAVGDYVFPSVFESNVIHPPEAMSSNPGPVASKPPLYGNELGNADIDPPTHHFDDPVAEQPASTNYGGPDVPRPPTIAESFESAFVRGNEAARVQSDSGDMAEPTADTDAFLPQSAGVAVAAPAMVARHAPSPQPRKTRKRLNTTLIKNPWLRRSAWVASGVVGLILLLVFALPFVLPNKTIAQEISRQVQSATGWTLKVDGPISVGIFPTPSFRADGVAVSADGENNVLSVESLRFGINLAAIFTGEVRLSEVILIGPSIDLIVDENGRPTWQTSDTITGAGTSGTDSGLRGSSGDQLVVDDTKSALQALERLQIDEVVIRDGTVRYRDLSSTADYTVTDIDLRTALTSLDVPMQL